MARPCEFDEDDVLDRAMQTFWLHGYDGTSLEDLLAATGIARQSLYNRFGDKRALFIRALRRYHTTGGAKLQPLFDQIRPVQAAFRQLFESASSEDDDAKRMGCFMINAAMEMARHDVEIADIVTRNQRAFEDLFVTALEAGKARGELPADFDCRATGRFLVGAFFGLKVLAKSDPSSPILGDMVNVTLNVLPA